MLHTYFMAVLRKKKRSAMPLSLWFNYIYFEQEKEMSAARVEMEQK